MSSSARRTHYPAVVFANHADFVLLLIMIASSGSASAVDCFPFMPVRLGISCMAPSCEQMTFVSPKSVTIMRVITVEFDDINSIGLKTAECPFNRFI